MPHCWKMPVVYIVSGVASAPGCPSPRCRSVSKQCQKGLCCVDTCNKLLCRRCKEQPYTGISSLGFFFTEACNCTHWHPARGHHPGRPAAAEARCVDTNDLTVSVCEARALYDRPNVDTISAKRSNVCVDRYLHFACDFATEVGDVGSFSRQSGTRSQSAGVLGRQRVCRFAVAFVCTCSPQQSDHCID